MSGRLEKVCFFAQTSKESGEGTRKNFFLRGEDKLSQKKEKTTKKDTGNPHEEGDETMLMR